MQDVSPATDPPTREYVSDDTALSGKKITAYASPASIFTGRCRMWVQAMYGEHLYSNNAAKTATTPPYLDANGDLSVVVYQRSDDKTVYSDLKILISTGVYLDETTGKHWLFRPNYEQIDVIPLISTSCGEKLRKFLMVPHPSDVNPLGEEDREHLEAYILSGCRPDVKNVITHRFSDSAMSGTPLAYSWHWNWKGDAADIVMHTSFFQEHTSGHDWEAMTATHSRLSLVPTQIPEVVSGDVITPATTTFEATLSTVEGPKNWAVVQLLWCIAVPDWGSGGMKKPTPKFSVLFDCDAPYYVFYIRDELKVCRVKLEVVPAAERVRRMSPFFNGSFPGSWGGYIEDLTLGMQDGYLEDEEATGQYYKATFTCGDEVFDELTYMKAEGGARHHVYGKRELNSFVRHDTEFVVHGHYAPPDVTAPAVTYCIGDPLPFNTWAYLDFGDTYYQTAIPATIQYTLDLGTYTVGYTSLATLIIPFFDSEAIYMHCEAVRTKTFVRNQTEYSTGLFVRVVYPLLWNANASLNYALGPYCSSNVYSGPQAGHGVVVATHSVADDVEVDTRRIKKLICRAGSLEATMDDLSPFHDGDINPTSTGYAAYSGSRKIEPTVVAPRRVTSVGTSENTYAHHVMVGWI
jgi:hypothetical protein